MKRGVLAAFILLLLAACASKEEKILSYFEKTSELEKDFVETQEKLVEAEKKEQKAYEELVMLNTDEIEKINKLTNQAISLVKEREELLNSEKESIDNAYEEFKKVHTLIKKGDGEALKEAKEISETMKARHDAYQNVYNAYKKSASADKKLYELFSNEELKRDELEKQVKAVNENYKTVHAEKERFNEATAKYNSLKEAFYKSIKE